MIFRQMEQLTWSSSATTLNQVIQYEAVHKIASWDELRHRLEKDRRVYRWHTNHASLSRLLVPCFIFGFINK
jgi:hypothetical protein